MPIDLSKVTREELMTIHSEVLRNIALQTKEDLAKDITAAGHDSHGSNHSNNKIVDLQSQVSEILRR
ncbi:hypothetical protein QN362_16270 [Actimicrobium sp. CCC2.4]|uniref:hypothetical protein n=1 Tax=Actimicrobium sp. CCC2.4 TaxID=3048606 RepID=UPI002AC93338|nr:hypothetical protein [Actimicrobium sp. CCC2.4]MEB0136892.1 hypothetical protein [Actimicrobium sp. CCC2.4]WPX33442.1 hypothetical protein RHM62_06290 [Actimicrobium sp. CCC2.4]